MSFNMNNTQSLEENYIRGILPKRDPNGHKGTFGSALIVCGSYSMAGAAVLAGLAANKTGCGLVRQVVPKSIYPIVSANVVESVYHIMNESIDKTVSKENIPQIIELINNSSAALIGCGMKNTVDTKEIVLNAVQKVNKPLVLDADGINVLKDSIDILLKSSAPLVLTPHIMEFSRISGLKVNEITSDPQKHAGDFARKFKCVMVLKGHNTVVAAPDGRVFINKTGNSGMAKGGSGDVLSGIVVSFLAQGVNVFDAASLAVYIHGLAGDIAAQKNTEFAMTASDIINNLGDAFQRLI